MFLLSEFLLCMIITFKHLDNLLADCNVSRRIWPTFMWIYLMCLEDQSLISPIIFFSSKCDRHIIMMSGTSAASRGPYSRLDHRFWSYLLFCTQSLWRHQKCLPISIFCLTWFKLTLSGNIAWNSTNLQKSLDNKVCKLF